ncbi:hypothetical protein BH24ACT5_BH24ACT5_02900 [soil metagenome]
MVPVPEIDARGAALWTTLRDEDFAVTVSLAERFTPQHTAADVDCHTDVFGDALDALLVPN